MECPDSGLPSESGKRKAATTASINISKKSGTHMKRVSSILRKKEESLTAEDKRFLEENAKLVEQFHKRKEKRAVWQSRKNEQEDSAEVLEQKCQQMAQAIHDAEFLVIYTGAGISTAASIPDYRGPNGIWTLLQKGLDIGHHDLSAAEPTLTHMALSALYHEGIVKHVVSQNCDGLHLRSGLPKSAMSELHGNMYIEVCEHCNPAREYVRSFDVTEKTSTFKHTTGRRCYRCGEPVIDTIVHFGERGKLRWPLNWQGACQAANACDTILCLGSSLKVLKKYPWLWQMDRPPKKRPSLYIVNLQWTPKDKDATLKINGKCDDVMALVMKAMGFELPYYYRTHDPIFHLATPLHEAEANISSRPQLVPPPKKEDEEPDVETLVEDDTKGCVTGSLDNDVRWKEVFEDGSEEHKRRKVEEGEGGVIKNEIKVDSIDVKSEVKSELDQLKDEPKDDESDMKGICSPLDLSVANLSKNADDVKDCESIRKDFSVMNCDVPEKSIDGIKVEESIDGIKVEEQFGMEALNLRNNGFAQLYKALNGRNITLNQPYSNDIIESMMLQVKNEISENDVNKMSSEENLNEEEEKYELSDVESPTEEFSRNSLEEREMKDEPLEGIMENTKPSTMEEYCTDGVDDIRSEYSDSDEELQTSDGDDDEWLSDMGAESFVSPMLESIKSSDTSSDSDMSERSEFDKVEDMNVSDSSQSGALEYYKLAYASTNVQAAQQGHGALKQSEFYGTGLCIRSLGSSKGKCNQVANSDDADNKQSITATATDQQPLDLTNEVSNDAEQMDMHKSKDCSGIENPSCSIDNIVGMSSLPNSCQSPLNSLPNDSCSSSFKQSPDFVDEAEMQENFDSNKVGNISGELCNSFPLSQCLHNTSKNDNYVSFDSENMKDRNEILKHDIHLLELNSLRKNVSQEMDNSFVLRTHVVDGIIKEACAETVEGKECDGFSNKNGANMSSPIFPQNYASLLLNSSQSIPENKVFVPNHSHKIGLCETSSPIPDTKRTASELLIPRRSSYLEQELAERESLKSLWYKSFCDANVDKTSASMNKFMYLKNGKILRKKNTSRNNLSSGSEKNGSVILKDICAESVSDSVARQKGSSKRKLKGCDNEDVKYIWFWGFNSNSENNSNTQTKDTVVIGTDKSVENMENVKDASTDESDSPPVARVTRSRTRASSDSRGTAEVEVFKCHCSGSNPDLCNVLKQRQPIERCEELDKARDIFRRRRTVNYKKYDPVFEKKLESFTFERTKPKRKPKFEQLQTEGNDIDEEECDEQESEVKENDEQKASDVEESNKEKDEKEEKKFTPGWYGKGLKKGLKKKTRV